MFNAKQKGLSPIGILFVVCTFAFFVMSGLKLAEHYIDYNTIRAVYKELAQRPDIKQMPAGSKLDEISKSLTLNNVRDWNINQNTYFNTDKGDSVLGFSYEVRVHMFANIDVVLSFDYEAELE